MLETRNQPIGARAPIGASAPIGPHGGGPNQDDEGGCKANNHDWGRRRARELANLPVNGAVLIQAPSVGPEPAAKRPMKIAHYHRFADYDYSRGASLFVSLSTGPRRRLFGEVVAPGEMILSPFGKEVFAAIEFTFAKSPGFTLYGHAVLPDHCHFRFYLAPGVENAAAAALINSVVGRFKSYTTHLYQRKYGGHGVLWQEGFHDWLCMSREMIDSVERYIAYNALKWWLRNGGGRSLMALHEPLKSPRLGQSEFWRGINATDLDWGRPLVALRVSRRCRASEVAALVARISAKAGEIAIISGFISAGEREVFAALLADPAARLIKVSPYALPHDYAPSVGLMPAIAEGRLAIIARGNSPEEISRAACLDYNARIVEIADKAAYALPGEVKWLK